MKYLIVQDWPNTRGNHAGMEHMCDMLTFKYPDKYRKYVNPEQVRPKSPRNRIVRLIKKVFDRLCFEDKQISRYKRICKTMLSNLKFGDEVFLLEYLFNAIPQYGFALYLRKKYPWLNIYALSHLSPSYLPKTGITDISVFQWSQPIDKMLTLGSSLSSYFVECGVPSQKVSTGFHYVDNNYYRPTYHKENTKLRGICIGALQRNHRLMAEVIGCIPQVEWIVCRGNNTSIDILFEGYSNVQLKGFIDESELLAVMDTCDISLNVMDDTIGSNVITTSMAMGLALVVSDVGSVRDYCTDGNAIFCDNTKNSFVKGIQSLVEDRGKLSLMKSESLKLSERFNIAKIDEWFSMLSST